MAARCSYRKWLPISFFAVHTRHFLLHIIHIVSTAWYSLRLHPPFQLSTYCWSSLADCTLVMGSALCVELPAVAAVWKVTFVVLSQCTAAIHCFCILTRWNVICIHRVIVTHNASLIARRLFWRLNRNCVTHCNLNISLLRVLNLFCCSVNIWHVHVCWGAFRVFMCVISCLVNEWLILMPVVEGSWKVTNSLVLLTSNCSRLKTDVYITNLMM